MFRSLLQLVGLLGAVALVALAALLVFAPPPQEEVVYVEYERPILPTEPEKSPEDSLPIAEEITAQPVSHQAQVAAAADTQRENRGTEVHRVRNPYPTPALSDAELYTRGRAALVNIYCQSKGVVGSISGSGVIIDPKGVILTNAHVAQYLLLATDSSMRVSCYIRTGSPSQNRYKADILYMPKEWIAEHASDIAEKRPMGTGEYDYTLLRITETIDGTALPTTFSHLPIDTRENIAFTGDRVLLAGYPAEFAIKTTSGASLLYPTSVFTTVDELLTFKEASVDLLALGGAVIAQSGSSGGAVINAWGYLVGIISTTSEGASTRERELRAVTLAYVNRDIARQTGVNLPTLLSGDIAARATTFMTNEVPGLAAQLTSFIR